MLISGNSSVGRARPCQGRGREFESRFPLQILKSPNRKIWAFLLLKLLILSILKLIKQKNLQKENNHIKGVEHFDCKLLNRIARKCNGMYSKAFIFYQRIQS